MHKDRVNEIFNSYLSNIEIYSEKGIIKDGEILANLIFLKYGGEDMIKVVENICKHIYQKNRFVSNIVIKK